MVAGRRAEAALKLLGDAAIRSRQEAWAGTAPLAHFHRAQLLSLEGREAEAEAEREVAARADSRYCFPSRLEDALALRAALAHDPGNGRASTLLGHWCYDRGRRDEAIVLWQAAVEQDPADAVAWRNLGIAHHNVRHDRVAAAECFTNAVAAAPDDGRLLYSRTSSRTAQPPNPNNDWLLFPRNKGWCPSGTT